LNDNDHQVLTSKGKCNNECIDYFRLSDQKSNLRIFPNLKGGDSDRDFRHFWQEWSHDTPRTLFHDSTMMVVNIIKKYFPNIIFKNLMILVDDKIKLE